MLVSGKGRNADEDEGSNNVAAPDAEADDADAQEDVAIDELGQDEAKTYQIRMSKWCDGTIKAITNCIFWFLLNICRAYRSPLRHFFLYVQAQSTKGRCLFNLVVQKLSEIEKEFHRLFWCFDEIVAQALDRAGCDVLDAEDILSLKLIARRLLNQQWAAFQRRIARPLQRCQ